MAGSKRLRATASPDTLEGDWLVERVAGLLPPLGLTKRIAKGRGWTRLAGIPVAPFRVVGRTLVYRGWPIRDDLEQESEGSWSGRGLVLGREFCRFRLVRPPDEPGAWR